MENQKNSGDMFSFPEFEFGSPDSPLNDPNKTINSSPADRFFFNGRLLPHVFPTQDNTSYGTTRRSSSVSSSKDSFMTWSPSASTNSSRSSSCSSARTSSSDISERKLFLYNINQNKFPSKATTPTTITTRSERNHQANRHALMSSTQAYGSSKRWQFITPAPALNPEFSRRKKVAVEVVVKDDLRTKKEVKERSSKKSGLGRRFFQSFMFACRECHAMAPSAREDVLQRSCNDL